MSPTWTCVVANAAQVIGGGGGGGSGFGDGAGWNEGAVVAELAGAGRGLLAPRPELPLVGVWRAGAGVGSLPVVGVAGLGPREWKPGLSHAVIVTRQVRPRKTKAGIRQLIATSTTSVEEPRPIAGLPSDEYQALSV